MCVLLSSLGFRTAIEPSLAGLEGGWKPLAEVAELKEAFRLGAADGSDDDKIRPEGIASYSCCDEDGGPEGCDSDPEEPEGSDVNEDGGSDEDASSHVLEAEGGENDQDDGELDDTGEPDTDELWREPLGDAECPEGFSFVSTCPPLSSTLDKNKIIGHALLFKYDAQDRGAYGWYRAKVALNDATADEKMSEPSLNFRIRFDKRDTNHELGGVLAVELTNDNYGPGKKWALIDKIPPS